jgi:bifunctional NMN adenylyltransferase/nudix hydrolase
VSDKQFSYLVFVGRFEPFHIGHKEVIDRALQLAEKVVILVGSSNQPRTIKNPFTFDERKQMILDTYGFSDRDSISESANSREYQRLLIAPLRDQKYNDQAWSASVQHIVQNEVLKGFGWSDKPLRGGLIGHAKDSSSYYLKMFPQWELVEHPMNEEVHATDIRTLFFESNIRYLNAVVPKEVYRFLEKFSNHNDFSLLKKEFEFIKQYKKSWEVAPYPVTFVTSDAVVIQSGHVLLVQRKAEPGKGLWALPGGFVGQNERIEDAMIRELREETKLKVPDPVLRGSIKGREVFDHPDRSLRGRTVTQAFYIELTAGKLPSVKGSDDAAKAKWVPLSFVREEEMFEDHYSILKHFIGTLS